MCTTVPEVTIVRPNPDDVLRPDSLIVLEGLVEDVGDLPGGLVVSLWVDGEQVGGNLVLDSSAVAVEFWTPPEPGELDVRLLAFNQGGLGAFDDVTYTVGSDGDDGP